MTWSVTGEDGVCHVIDPGTWWSPCMHWRLARGYSVDCGAGEREDTGMCERVENVPRYHNVTVLGSAAIYPTPVATEHQIVETAELNHVEIPITCLVCLVAR